MALMIWFLCLIVLCAALEIGDGNPKYKEKALKWLMITFIYADRYDRIDVVRGTETETITRQTIRAAIQSNQFFSLKGMVFLWVEAKARVTRKLILERFVAFWRVLVVPVERMTT